MSEMQQEGLSAQGRLMAGQAMLNVRSFNNACRETSRGNVLRVAEMLAMEQGQGLCSVISTSHRKTHLKTESPKSAPSPC